MGILRCGGRVRPNRVPQLARMLEFDREPWSGAQSIKRNIAAGNVQSSGQCTTMLNRTQHRSRESDQLKLVLTSKAIWHCPVRFG